jgi:hypothetical protein
MNGWWAGAIVGLVLLCKPCLGAVAAQLQESKTRDFVLLSLG